MIEILVKKADSHETCAMTKDKIEASPTRTVAYLLRKPDGFIVEVQDGGYFARKDFSKGKPWRGDKFCLVVVTNASRKDVQALMTTKVVIYSSKYAPIYDNVVDVIALPNQTVWYNNGMVQEEYTVARVEDILLKKATYEKVATVAPTTASVEAVKK